MESILITGANRGIGLELVKQSLHDGKQVYAACRRPDDADDLQALACKQLKILPLDVNSEASVASLASALEGTCIDVLVNNAGVMGGEHQTLNDMDFDAWAQTLAINTLGPVRVSIALLPNLKLANKPRIVTVSSQMGAFGLDMGAGTYAYRTSKAAVSKAMQLMAIDLKADGIIVVPIHPGWVQTDMGGPQAQIPPEQSVEGIIALINNLEPQQSGRFWTYEGKEHVW